MNIVDAIKSGKRFRRKSQLNQGYWYREGAGSTFCEDDVLADDWEVESPAVTITREQFNKACQSVLGRFASDHILVVCWLGLTKSERTITAVLTDLGRELGL